MILSKEQLLSDDQAITGTEVSDNVIDLGAPGTVLGAPAALTRDVGKGNPVPILVEVTEAFTLLTSLQLQLQVDNDEAFGSAKLVDESPAIALADLVAGYKFPMLHLPPGVDERYMRLRYVVAGTNPDAGKITASIAAAVQTNDTVPGA
jgi:hypothetical protein